MVLSHMRRIREFGRRCARIVPGDELFSSLVHSVRFVCFTIVFFVRGNVADIAHSAQP